jgi:hypothetical protein
VCTLLIPGDKYEAVSTDNDYKKYMMLKIRSVKHSDFGSYKCVAKNSLGETDGIIKLDGKLIVNIPEVMKGDNSSFVPYASIYYLCKFTQ